MKYQDKLSLDFYIQGGDHLGAAGTQSVFIGLLGVHPAAGAFYAPGFRDANGQAGEISAAAGQRALRSGFPST